MEATDDLARRFEDNRTHLTAVAFRILGSVSEADDAVQEAWLRLSRTDADAVDNLSGWLTTVVSRVCLDMLRSRARRNEEPIGEAETNLPPAALDDDPEREAMLADSVGMAMLVVLQTLPPAERVAFVLHDLFAVSFDDIGAIVGRSSAAARQLASRGRRKVQHRNATEDTTPTAERAVVEAFLSAAREGNFDALLAVLDPDVVLRADATALRMGAFEASGAQEVAENFAGRARGALPATLDGEPGLAWVQHREPKVVFDFLIADGRIVEIELIADEDRLAGMTIDF